MVSEERMFLKQLRPGHTVVEDKFPGRDLVWVKLSNIHHYPGHCQRLYEEPLE